MPARSEWKGFIQISQLQVAVKAFSACSSEPDIALNQLHRDCGERIRQSRVCPIHGAVESDAIILGYQVFDNSYIPIEPEDLKELKPEPNKSLIVECFIGHQEIDPVFHAGRTLYLVPCGPPDQRPFGVLREGMKSTGKHAFSRAVISGREHLVVVRPYGKLMAMTFVEYAQRVRKSSDYESEIANVVPGAAEMSIVRQLIETMTENEFDLNRYHDEYMDRLNTLIEQRVAAADLMGAADRARHEPDDGALLAVLKASLAAAGVNDSVMPRNLEAVSDRVREDERIESRSA